MGYATRTPGLTAGLAILLLAATVAGHPFLPRAQEPDRPPSPEPKVRAETKLVPQHQWEYRQLPCTPAGAATRERSEFLDQLNDAGRHGWELVGVLELKQVPGRECILATLKRAVLN